MTAPLIVTPDELHAQLTYMGEVVAVLRNTTRPVGNPVITRAEYAAMGHARTMGLSAGAFADRLAASDRVTERMARTHRGRLALVVDEEPEDPEPVEDDANYWTDFDGINRSGPEPKPA